MPFFLIAQSYKFKVYCENIELLTLIRYRLRKEKVEFDNYMQQDAHEFLNFLINHINEIIVAEQAAAPPQV